MARPREQLQKEHIVQLRKLLRQHPADSGVTIGEPEFGLGSIPHGVFLDILDMAALSLDLREVMQRLVL